MMQRLGKTKTKSKVPQAGPKKPKSTQPRTAVASAPFTGDMSEHPSVILRKGLGTMQVLSDHDVIVIFRELSAKDLLTLSTVSKAWHQFCNWDELWRLLCFDLWEGDFVYKYTWKLTALFPHADPRAIRPELITPKRVDGFYSDYMYRKWYRSTQIDYTSFERDTEDIEQIDVTGIDGEEIALTLEQFREQYDKPYPSHGVPVILRGIAENWPALSDPTRAWTPDNLAERFKDHLFKIGEHNRHKKRVWMTMRDYLTYMRSQRDDKPIYLFDDGFAERVPELLKDYSIPEYFIEDLYAAMGDHRPPFRWVIIGPARSGTPFHIDPHGTSAWNALLYGKKRWALYPPHISPPGLKVETDAQGNILDMSSAYPTRFYHQMFAHMNEEHKPIEFVQEAGDMVFIPGGWWHQVLNLTETVSVTQNMVNTSNLKWVVQSMCQHKEFEALTYWRDKILPLRPEVYKTINKQMDWMHGRDAINKVQLLKDKKKQQQQREEEYKQEIERLKNELAKLGSGTQTNGVPNGVHKDV